MFRTIHAGYGFPLPNARLWMAHQMRGTFVQHSEHRQQECSGSMRRSSAQNFCFDIPSVLVTLHIPGVQVISQT